jgi:hypothetical protein
MRHPGGSSRVDSGPPASWVLAMIASGLPEIGSPFRASGTSPVVRPRSWRHQQTRRANQRPLARLIRLPFRDALCSGLALVRRHAMRPGANDPSRAVEVSLPWRGLRGSSSRGRLGVALHAAEGQGVEDVSRQALRPQALYRPEVPAFFAAGSLVAAFFRGEEAPGPSDGLFPTKQCGVSGPESFVQSSRYYHSTR